MRMAKGSLAEVETYLMLAGRLKFSEWEHLVPAWLLAQEVGKMLTSLHHRLLDKPGTA